MQFDKDTLICHFSELSSYICTEQDMKNKLDKLHKLRNEGTVHK